MKLVESFMTMLELAHRQAQVGNGQGVHSQICQGQIEEGLEICTAIECINCPFQVENQKQAIAELEEFKKYQQMKNLIEGETNG